MHVALFAGQLHQKETDLIMGANDEDSYFYVIFVWTVATQ